MTRITVDPLTQAKLRAAHETLELCDDSGKVLGHFVPAVDSSRQNGLEPEISEEELQRREQHGGGRPLAEILADLEKRG